MESVNILSSDDDNDSDCCIIEEISVKGGEFKIKDESDGSSKTKRVKKEDIDFSPSNFSVKKMLGDGHCILHCFSEYFKDHLDTVKFRLQVEFNKNIDTYEQFSNLDPEDILAELNNFVENKTYNSDTVDLVIEALSNVYQHRVFIFYNNIYQKPTGIIGEIFSKHIYLLKSLDHYDLVLKEDRCCPPVNSDDDVEDSCCPPVNTDHDVEDSCCPPAFNTDYNEGEFSFSYKNPTAECLLFAIMVDPRKFEEQKPLKGIHKDKMYTIRRHTLEEVTCDDNGAYEGFKNVKKEYFVEFDLLGSALERVKARVVHSYSGKFYIKERSGQRAYNDREVSAKNVLTIERYYRQNKSIPGLRNLIVRIKFFDKLAYEEYFCVIYYRGVPSEGVDAIDILPHGNSLDKLASPYIRTSSMVLDQEDNLLRTGTSTIDVYDRVLSDCGGPLHSSSHSIEPRNLKQIRNRKAVIARESQIQRNPSIGKNDELTQILLEQRTPGIIQAVSVTHKAYFVFLYQDKQINDIVAFCTQQIGSTPLAVDTTFNLCDLWVTDTAYKNKRLISPRTKKHPVCLGPIMLHFTKNDTSFGRFALELVAANPQIKMLQKIGVDMDSAIFKGFNPYFDNLAELICVRHLSQRDEVKISKLLDRSKAKEPQKKHSKAEIIRDIYGHKTDSFKEIGLADASDEEDFLIKLASLQEKWNKLCPGFFDWFMKQRKHKFIESVIQSARENTSVTGLYYQNDVESIHAVEKCLQNYQKKDVVTVIGRLKALIDHQENEEVRALYGGGNYVLSNRYKKFFVQSSTWHSWSVQRKEDHVKKFRQHSPVLDDAFTKPKNSGRKPSYQKRKRNDNEPEIILDRINKANSIVSPASSVPENSSDKFIDPRVNPPKRYELHLRSKIPALVTKCQGNCGKKISKTDVMVARSYGTANWTDKKTGQERSKYGPMYIHFVDSCLKKFDNDTFYAPSDIFDYSRFEMDSETKKLLSDEDIKLYKNLGVRVY